MKRPEWVEVGADKLAIRTGYPLSTARAVVEAVLAVVEPLIRADERAKAHVHATGTSTGDGPCCQCCYDLARGES